MSKNQTKPVSPIREHNINGDSIIDVICANAPDRDKCELYVERLREADNNIRRSA